MPLPSVAIVGAPNVGKSRLFNRLAGRRPSLVHSRPGLTRDCVETRIEIDGCPLILVDTGGVAPSKAEPLGAEVERRALRAAQEADLVLFVVDLKTGVSPFERDLVARLRRQGRPILLVLNKVDATRNSSQNRHEAWQLGLGEGVEVSAEHGIGLAELCEAIAARLPRQTASVPARAEIPVAIVGRPNAGKSLLFNRLLRTDRSIVSPVPGTTRGGVEACLEHGEQLYKLVDTAGLRRGARVTDPVEALTGAVARGALARSAIALLVIDAARGLDRQDLAVAGLALRTYRPLVVALNKIDRLSPPALATLKRQASYELAFASYAPVVPVSALSGRGLSLLLSTLDEVWQQGGRRVPTASLNRLLQEFSADAPGMPRRRRVRLLYATQEGTHPPAFVFFGRRTGRPHFTFRRALENFLRRRLELARTPMVLRFRSGSG
ncbi:MAG: ribosome biogenesis GTPase Der [Gemmataceae bacterium]|nr:ribosome biogenesis GTPase Der [Gemmataceae bacterium]